MFPSIWQSVCPHGRTRLPLFPLSFIFEYISKTWRENSTLITRITGTLYEELRKFMVLVEIFARWGMCQIRVVEKIKTNVSCSTIFSRKSCCLCNNVAKCGRASQAADENTILRSKGAICILDKLGYRHTLTICSIHCSCTGTVVAWTCIYITSGIPFLCSISCFLPHHSYFVDEGWNICFS